MRASTARAVQAGCCFVCAWIAFRYSLSLGNEFSGGRITGPILDLFDIGTVFLAVGGLLTVFLRRIGAVFGLVGILLCLPLYIYDTAPGPFREVFRGEYSVPLQSNFVWARNNVAGLIALSVLSAVCIRAVVMARKTNNRHSNAALSARPPEFK